MSTATRINTKRGATLRGFTFQLTEDDVAVDLTALAVTAVTLKMRRSSTGELTIDGAAMTIFDDSAGIVSYAPADADVIDSGEFEIEIWTTNAAGKPDKWPDEGFFRLTIHPDLST